MGFHHDVYFLTSPECVGPVEESVELELWEHARIRVNQEKLKFGTDVGIVHPTANTLSTQMVNHGGVTTICPRTGKALEFWAPFLGTRTSSKQSSPRRLVNTEPSWRESGRSRFAVRMDPVALLCSVTCQLFASSCAPLVESQFCSST